MARTKGRKTMLTRATSYLLAFVLFVATGWATQARSSSEPGGGSPFAPETLGLRVATEGTNIRVQGPAFQMLLPMASDWEYYPPTWDYEHGLLTCRSKSLKMYVTLGGYKFEGNAEQYFEGSFGDALRKDSGDKQAIKDRRFLSRVDPVIFAARSTRTEPAKPLWTTVRKDREGRILMFTVSALETLHPSEADVAAIEKYVVETMTPSLIGVPESETARPCYEIPIPGTSLTVVADLPGFVPTMFGVGKEGNIERLFFAVRDKTHFHVGIQRKVTEQTPQAYRSLYWSEVQRIQRALPNGMHQILDLSMSDTQKMAILEYTSQDHMKVMNIRHADGFMVKDDIGIHVLVSKRHFASGDEQELRNILAAVQLKER